MKSKLILCFGVLSVLLLMSCKIQNYYDDPDLITSDSDGSVSFGSVLIESGNKYNYKVSKFNGMKTIRTISKSGELNFEIDLIISDGRFKLVLVKDKEIILVTDKNTNEIISLNNLENGTYKLKIIGDEAKFDLKLKL